MLNMKFYQLSEKIPTSGTDIIWFDNPPNSAELLMDLKQGIVTDGEGFDDWDDNLIEEGDTPEVVRKQNHIVIEGDSQATTIKKDCAHFFWCDAKQTFDQLEKLLGG